MVQVGDVLDKTGGKVITMNSAHSSPTPISSKPTSTAPNSSDRQNPLPIQVRVKAMALTHLRPRFRQNLPPLRRIQATVKTLFSFKCMSKPWRLLISNPDFVKTHLHCAEFKRLILASPNSHYSINNENPCRKQRHQWFIFLLVVLLVFSFLFFYCCDFFFFLNFISLSLQCHILPELNPTS